MSANQPPVNGTVAALAYQRDAHGATVLASGKWEVFLIATGERFERWPVDAQEMLRTGAYSLVPPVVE